MALVLLAGVAASPLRAENRPADLSAYVRARAADAGGRAGEAAASYATALQGDPGNPLVAIRAYRAALAAGDEALSTRARLVLEKADTAPPDAALVALAEAVVAGNHRAQAAAIDRIGGGALDFLVPALRGWSDVDQAGPAAALAMVTAPPGNPIARLYANENRALLMIAAGQVDEGVALIQALGGATTADPDLRIAAARLLAGAGMTARAVTMLAGGDPVLVGERTRIGQSASRPTAAFGIGYVMTRLASDLNDGRAGKLSIALTRSALRLDPGNERARLLLASALGGSNEVMLALGTLDSIVPGSPYFQQAQVAQIELLDNAGRRDEAIALAAERAASKTASGDDLRRHGDLLMTAGDYGAAAAAYQRAIALGRRAGAQDEDDWVLHMLLGTMLERVGQWSRARSALQRAVDLAPDQPLALNALGYAMLEHGGDLATARRLLERANRLSPGDLAILDSLAWSYVAGGDVARALPLLERAAKGRPGDSDIREHLGDVYWRLGRRYEARYAWEAARFSAEPAAEGRLTAKIAYGLSGKIPTKMNR